MEFSRSAKLRLSYISLILARRVCLRALSDDDAAAQLYSLATFRLEYLLADDYAVYLGFAYLGAVHSSAVEHFLLYI